MVNYFNYNYPPPASGDPFSVNIEVTDSTGMLARLTDAIAKLDTNIQRLEAVSSVDRSGQVIATIEVRNRKQLQKVVSILERVRGVVSVDRYSGRSHQHESP